MGDNSMSEFRPRLLLCLVAIVALGAIGLIAAFSVKVGRAADKAGLDSRGYVWSATRIESGIRLRGWVPTDEDRRTVLGMVKAHFPDLQVEDRLKAGLIRGLVATGTEDVIGGPADELAALGVGQRHRLDADAAARLQAVVADAGALGEPAVGDREDSVAPDVVPGVLERSPLSDEFPRALGEQEG